MMKLTAQAVDTPIAVDLTYPLIVSSIRKSWHL